MRTVLLLLFLALPSGASPLEEAKRVTPPEFGEARQPQIAIDQRGLLFVAFGKGNAVYVSKSENEAGPFGEPVKLAELNRLALGMRRGPRIATAGAAVVVTAISHTDGNLYFWRSEDHGRSWSKTSPVNDAPKAAVEGLHGLASDGRNKIAAVWLDLRNGKTELWASVSDDAGKTWPANTRVYRSPDRSICECCHPSVVFMPAGEIIVLWRNWLDGSRDMYRARSSDGGKSFSEATKLGTGTWKLQACPMDGGSLAVAGDQIAYAWREDRKILAATDPSSETVLAQSGTHPVVIRTAQGAAFLWQDAGNLYWRSGQAAASGLFSEGASFAASAWHPRQKNSVVVWESGDGIYARVVR